MMSKSKASLLIAAILFLATVATSLLLVFGVVPASAPVEADTVTIVTHEHSSTSHTKEGEKNLTWTPLIERQTIITNNPGKGFTSSNSYLLKGKSGVIDTDGAYYLCLSNESGTADESIAISQLTPNGAATVHTITIKANVTLCLNGYYITGDKQGPVITVESGYTFTLCDCQHDNAPGRVRQGKNLYGGGVYVKNGGKFIMNGGVIRASSAVRGGGVYVASGATFEMNGGRIRKNTTYNSEVGEIEKDKASNGNGAGVYVATNGTFTMNGGEIFQNKAAFSGGGVYVAYSSEAQSTQKSGKVIINNGKISNNIAVNGGGIACNRGTVEVNGGIIGGDEDGDTDIDDGVETEEALNKGNTATKRGGGIYCAAGNVTVSNDALIKRNRVTSTNETDTDECGGGGVHIIQNGNSEKSTFTMTGGTITENSSWRGGGVYAGPGGEFSMSGGTINNNTADQSGGGVYAYTDGTLEMSGGTVSGNTADQNGGGVILDRGTAFTLSGGEISGNTSSTHGGGIYMSSNAKLTMTAGKINGNEATSESGGGVCVAGDKSGAAGEFIMEGGEVNNNTANFGGGISSIGDVTIKGGTISGNNATGSNGGGIFAQNKTLTLENATVSNNTAATTGGGVYVNNGCAFSMTSGTIEGNTATTNVGGGVYVSGSETTFTMSGGTISGNTATTNGGGAYVSADATVNMSGSPIINGNTLKDGTTKSNLFLPSGKVIAVAALETGATIGVTVERGRDAVFTSGYGANNTAAPHTYFISDDLNNKALFDYRDGKFEVKFSTAIAEVKVDGEQAIEFSTITEAFDYANGKTSVVKMLISYSSTIEQSRRQSLVLTNCNITLNLGKYYLGLSNSGHISISNGSLELTCEGTNNQLRDFDAVSEDGNGGAIYVGDKGTFILTGGILTANEAINGASVYVSDGGTFNMNGGEISFGTATNNGGGVYVADGGTFNMNGGTITNNTAKQNGGGVYVADGGTFKMSGGTIGGSVSNYKNTATGNGGGVYVDGSFTISGGKIVGNTNTSGDKKNNVYVGDKTISITEALKEGTQVGISVPSDKTSYDVTSGYGANNKNGDSSIIAPSGYFFADDDDHHLALINNEVVAHTLTHVAGKEFTCTEAGNIEYWNCSVCNKYFSGAAGTKEVSEEKTVIPASHTVKTIPAKAATCTEDGYKKAFDECTICGARLIAGTQTEITDEVFESEYLIKAAHKYEVIKDETPTCTEEGEKVSVCSVCSNRLEEHPSALGHDTEHFSAKNPDCTEAGNIEYWYCSRCGYYEDEDCLVATKDPTIPAIGHSYGGPEWEWTDDGDTVTATATFTCETCGHEEHVTAEEDAEENRVTYSESSVTCTQSGTRTYSAEVKFKGVIYQTEGEDKYEVTIPASGHDWDVHWENWQQNGDGWVIDLVFYCNNESQVIERQTVHGEVVSETLPTCVDYGKRVYKAVATNPYGYEGIQLPDDEEYTDNNIPIDPDNHAGLKQVSAQAPTCEEVGWYAYEYCDACNNYSTYEERDALGHDYEIIVDDSAMTKEYYAFDTVNPSGLKVTARCKNDADNDHSYEFTCSGLIMTGGACGFTYNDGDRLYYGDSKVGITVHFDGYSDEYGNYEGELDIDVSRRPAEDVEWLYGVTMADNGAELSEGAEFTYDPIDSRTVWVKFPVSADDDKCYDDSNRTGWYYYIRVGEFQDAKGYKFELSEYGNYSIADGVRNITVNRCPFPVGGEKWLNGNNSVLMDGYVIEEDGKYKYYSALPDGMTGATYATNAVVNYKNGTTVTVKYPDFAQTYPGFTAFYTVACVDNTATASGIYTAIATLTPTAYAIQHANNYEVVVADNLSDGVTVTLNPDGTVTVTKVWYAAISDNGFSGEIGDWTFGDVVTFAAAMSNIPELEQDDGADDTYTLILKRNGNQIGGTFYRNNMNDYINITMPVGSYTLIVTVREVTVDGIAYAGFNAEFTFTVSAATFAVSNIGDLKPIFVTYDGSLHINQSYTPTATLFMTRTGEWASSAHDGLYSTAVAITFSHADWNAYYTATQIVGLTSNRLFINADSYTALYKISANNYTDVSGSFAVVINKATYDLKDVVFEGKTFTYDKTATRSLAITGLPSGVSVSYDGNGKTNANESGYTVTATLSFTDKLNYKFINSAVENDTRIKSDTSAEYTATLIIEKATYDLKDVVFEDKTFTYDKATTRSLAITGLPSGVSVSYEGNNKINANETGYTVTATLAFADKVNYKFINSAVENDTHIKSDISAEYTALLIIEKAIIDLDLEFEGDTVEYDGKTHTISVKVNGTLHDGVLIKYYLIDDEDEAEFNGATAVGTYNVTAIASIRSAYADNYKFAADAQTSYEATLNITSAKIDMGGVRFDDKEVVYTGNAYSLSISGKLPQGVTYSYENNSCVEVGTHTVVVHFYHNRPDYGPIDDMTAELKINKAEYVLNVTFPDATVAYTGNAHSLAIRGVLPAGVTYEYDNNSRTAVGSQTVTVRFFGDTHNYKPIEPKNATLRVIPASLGTVNVSLEGKTFTYDGKAHSLSLDGTLPDGVSVKYYVLDGGKEVEFNGATAVGTYDVIARFIIPDSENYRAISPLSARLTILAAPTTEKPPVVEPSVDEVDVSIIPDPDYGKQSNVVVGDISQKEPFPYWIIAVCIIGAEVLAMAIMGCYIAFGAHKRKKR